MRGKEDCRAHKTELAGITPAYAGKSLLPLLWHDRFWDHPRVCGEKIARATPPFRHTGSPPRMRGKVDCRAHKTVLAGITPAYAGKRTGSRTTRRWRKDHPRVCGEKNQFNVSKCPTRGSPPRMRGKVPDGHFPGQIIRITPAYAGKSPSKPYRWLQSRDHPRVCGEKKKSRKSMGKF